MIYRPVPLVLLALLGICCIIEAVLLLSDFGALPNTRLRATAYINAAFWTGLLQDVRPNYAVQPYLMFFTYAFLHGGFVHLVVNMFTLFSLGRTVCLRVGAGGFVALYTAAVVGGAVAFGMLTDPAGPMVGASGGLFGLVGAILAWNTRDLRGAGESLSPVWRALVGLLLLNVVIWWATSGLLAWETHLGGFIAGWLVALVIRPQPDDFTN